jgi:AcrR family transcriptional regulator
MMRQNRSEATRQKIINAAVDVFSEVGYAAAGLADIIERAELTKGALYHHFDSKESLATAIMEESGSAVLDVFGRICESRSPALENLIHGLFVVSDLVARDKPIRIGTQLTQALGGSNEGVVRIYGSWLEAMSSQVKRAAHEGDLRAGLDPDAVGESILATLLGAVIIASALSIPADEIQRLTDMCQLLLPGIVADESLPYFREFLDRETLRHPQPAR